MPDNNEKRPNPQHHEDGVEETAHAGCGLPVLALLFGLIALLGK